MDQAAAGRALRKYLLMPHRYRVVAVKGPWGCGKTYLWTQTQEWLEEESDERYAPKPLYCSLFGRDSVAEIRKELLAQVLYENVAASSTARKFVTKVGVLLPDVIGLFSKTGETFAKVGEAVFNVAADAVTDRVLSGRRIVLDDMERRGPDLTVIAILGFIDSLRNNGSQIVVLFNDEKIGPADSRSQTDLMTFREKVFNVELEVRLSVAEAYKIALGDSKPIFESILLEQYLRFGITNIRVGQRVVQAVEHIFAGQQTLPQEIAREVMPAIVVVTGIYHTALPDWPSLSEVEKEIAERGIEHARGKRRVRERTSLDALVDAYLKNVEPEFFRLAAQHISTGDLLEQQFLDYWTGRIIRREADELYDDMLWSPSITRSNVIERGEDLMKKKDKLDKQRLRNLSSGFYRWSTWWLADHASAAADQHVAAAEAEANGISLTRIDMNFRDNNFEDTAANISGLAELEKAMWEFFNGGFVPQTDLAAVVRRGSTEMFEHLFGSTDRSTFRRGVLFLRAWLEENDEEWDGSIGTALRKVLARADSELRYDILHREIEIGELDRGSLSSARFNALTRELPDRPEPTHTTH